MAYGLYLVAENLSRRYEESVELSGGADAHVPVVDVVKTIDGVVNLHLSHVVPRLLYLVGVHTVGEVDGRIDVQIAEKREVAADGYVVLHSVTPVARETGVEQFVFLRCYGVGKLAHI